MEPWLLFKSVQLLFLVLNSWYKSTQLRGRYNKNKERSTTKLASWRKRWHGKGPYYGLSRAADKQPRAFPRTSAFQKAARILSFKSTLLIPTVSTNTFHATYLLLCLSCYHVLTSSEAPSVCLLDKLLTLWNVAHVYSCCLLKTNFRNMIEIFGCFIKKDPWEYSQYVSHGISKCSSCFPFLLATCLEKVFALINALSRRTSVGIETAQRKDSAPPPLPLPPPHFFRKKTCQAKHAPISCIS